ncbi:HDIG domain-containing metalloprotein [Streptomyces sp. SID3343]|uniref:HDIG domain-containing metalloprotein n=1 Tax=Streptomyces sp. SID3343 TaxID=2690260 RepID=UPI0013692527|nr:HDIG domain-containing metalloprotein [Streptomyces sp. SID3343]MYV97950.1 HDIG domain-containing protein [Streptomyces sp. SID3343]
MSQLPTVDEITALHRAYAPTREAFEKVHTHCGIVWRIAEQLLAGPGGAGVDGDLVRVGCLLHDIGVYRLYDDEGRLDRANYVRHGLLGAEIVSKEGLPESLGRFCSCHTGVGLTRHDVLSQDLPIPVGDYVAETAEERLVMYADKFHSKSTPPRFVTSATFAVKVQRFGEEKVVVFGELAEEFGEPVLEPLAAEYGHRIT